jgi:hypothetical protein
MLNIVFLLTLLLFGMYIYSIVITENIEEENAAKIKQFYENNEPSFFNPDVCKMYQDIDIKYKPYCENLLIQRDSKYYLFNVMKPHILGINPIEFKNLDEYSEHLKKQREKGIRCPVLYLQYLYNPQGEGEYQLKVSVTRPLQGAIRRESVSSNNRLNNMKGEDVLLAQVSQRVKSSSE